MVSFPSPAPVPPRRRGLRIAVVAWAVIVLVLIVLTVAQAVAYSSEPQDQHIPLAGGAVAIAEPGEYSVYYETDRDSAAELTAMFGPDGARVPVRPAGGSETYSVNERFGVKLGSFTAATPGAYRLIGTSETMTSSDELVVGTRSIGAVLGTVFTGVAAGMVLVVGGVALLLVFLFRRRKDSRPVGSFPGGPGPAGWPQPGGPYPGAPYGAPYPNGHDGARGR